MHFEQFIIKHKNTKQMILSDGRIKIVFIFCGINLIFKRYLYGSLMNADPPDFAHISMSIKNF